MAITFPFSEALEIVTSQLQEVTEALQQVGLDMLTDDQLEAYYQQTLKARETTNTLWRSPWHEKCRRANENRVA